MQTVVTETNNQLLILTISRPDKLNALNKQVLDELHDIISRAAADTSLRGIIITGAGRKAFAAGADISEFSGFGIEEGTELARQGQERVFDLIESCPKPVAAAVNGYALGGGLELALACHVRFASKNAKLGLPEVSLGLIPGYGGTQRLARLAGKGKALEMILTGKLIGTAEALELKLLNHTVGDPDELLPYSVEFFESILDKAPMAVAAAIRSVNDCFREGVNGFETEIEEFGKLFGTEDFREGTRAFLEKRKPVFKGS
ncbi:MAG TPA: enoyl-CoA hydratase-related protein [Anseongella sp.]|nr:enoyl-CoA hydratase-related protein [Anseongella sp.]